ncbi:MULTISPECIES: zinc-ribbon domain-containing protein [Aeromicrobium]|uniref:zinc-ribbon domain-containing protein n=1 Tax=Aeromicrobium TaxID=2040 RepID=UPI0035E42F3D
MRDTVTLIVLGAPQRLGLAGVVAWAPSRRVPAKESRYSAVRLASRKTDMGSQTGWRTPWLLSNCSPRWMQNDCVPGPVPVALLRDASPAIFAEALHVVGRPDVDVSTLGTGSNLPVRWRCPVCSHEWDAKPSARSRGTGCPACARAIRRRSRAQAPPGMSLADLFPQIASEFEANLDRQDMSPRDLRAHSKQRCLWRCVNGHRWEATVANRTTGRGCPQCANERRAELRRRPTTATGTAAGHATFPVTELVQNLTSPGLTLVDLRPNSVDRCMWKCSSCEFEWEATVVNRISKKSGCPECAQQRSAETRSLAPAHASLGGLHPDLARELVKNIARPDRTADQIWPGSNDLCQWRCSRGHEWVTTVASRVAGAGCSRCGARGQSRLEFEVAEILRISTGLRVVLDLPVRADGRTWRVDLSLPELDLLVDLDPKHWHSNTDRDRRKVDALASRSYVRIRPISLPSVGGRVCRVPDDDFDAVTWANALAPVLQEMGGNWREPTVQECGLALAAALMRWRETTQGRPSWSAIDAAPHLKMEFLANLTRPGISPDWLPPNARDRCSWRAACGHEWTSSIAARAGRGAGCPTCARGRTASASRQRSIASPAESLLATHPEIASEFVQCIVQPDRTPATLRPSSNLICRWRCSDCSLEFTAQPASRVRGRGCPACARTRAGELKSRVSHELSLQSLHPELAEEFIAVPARSDRTAADIAPGSNFVAIWRCIVCEHEWETAVASRALGGHGCPACARQRTVAARMAPRVGESLQDLFPELSSELIENLTHPGRGPSTLRPASHDRCRWRGSCGHEWINNVKNRTRLGSGCPICYRASRRGKRLSRGTSWN